MAEIRKALAVILLSWIYFLWPDRTTGFLNAVSVMADEMGPR